jgi:hypothetical protein
MWISRKWQSFLALSLGSSQTDPRRTEFIEDQGLSPGDPVMDGIPKMSREQYIEAMRSTFEEILGGVADAVNDAPEGRIINSQREKGPRPFSPSSGGSPSRQPCRRPAVRRFSPLRRTVTVVPSVTRGGKSGVF